MKTRKVVIIGAGHVGSHVALGLIQSGEADDIVLIDILKEKAAAQALDLDDCVSGALCGHDAVIRAGEYEELNDADIMVVAFGRSRKPGETRLDMFDDTIRMANEVIGHLKQVDFKGIMISISNPADIICEYIRRQILGAQTEQHRELFGRQVLEHGGQVGSRQGLHHIPQALVFFGVIQIRQHGLEGIDRNFRHKKAASFFTRRQRTLSFPGKANTPCVLTHSRAVLRHAKRLPSGSLIGDINCRCFQQVP